MGYIQLWGATANLNVKMDQRFQPKILKIIVDTSWFVINKTLYHDLNIPPVKDVIKKCAHNHTIRLDSHTDRSSSRFCD